MPTPDEDAAALAYGRMVIGQILAAGLDVDEVSKRILWAITTGTADIADPRLDPIRAERAEYVRLVARAAAEARWEAENALGRPWGLPVTATDWAKPPGEAMRFKGATLTNGRVSLVARKKVGKTTVMDTVIAEHLTGSPLLGHWPMAEPFTRRIMLLNYELPEAYEWDELDRVGLLCQDRLDVWNLRGRTNPLASERGRRELQLRMDDGDIGALFVDPLSGASRGIVKNDNDNALMRTFLGMLDEVVGMERDLWLSAHAGHGPETQVRGASEFEGWADTLLAVTKDEDGNRHLYIDGRGVDDVRWGDDAYGLDFDSFSHRVSIDASRTRAATKAASSATGAGSKVLAKGLRIGRLRTLILDVVTDKPGIITRDLESFVGGKSIEMREALGELLRSGDVVTGPVGRGIGHWIVGAGPPI